jgi:L-ascorbate metabolism protein UlaG (beta-lactamase superfamily)
MQKLVCDAKLTSMTAMTVFPLRLAFSLAAVTTFCALLVGCTSSKPCNSPYAASPQFHGCGFQNPPNPEALPSQSGLKIWTRFLFADKKGTVPVDPIPVRAVTAAQLDALDPQANHVIRIGHSSSLLKLRGAYWLIDPMFSERASPVQWFGPKRFEAPPIALEQLPPIAGLIISHDHFDHLDAATVRFLSQRVQRFFVPLGVGARLIELGVPSEHITELDWWQRAELNGVQVTATPAQHFSGRSLTDRDETLWASWVIQSGPQRLFYSGDGGYAPHFKAIGERFGSFDVALIENGAYDSYWPSVHMTPEQSVQAFLDVKAKVMLPVHNSTFDLAFHPWSEPMERVSNLAQGRQIDLATPVLGEVVTVGQPRTNVRWWSGLK